MGEDVIDWADHVLYQSGSGVNSESQLNICKSQNSLVSTAINMNAVSTSYFLLSLTR